MVPLIPEDKYILTFLQVFLDSLAGREFACRAGEPCSIPGSEDSLEKKQATYSSIHGLPWAQTVKNPPAMWETWVRSLGWEDPLEEDIATHLSILVQRIPWTEEPGGRRVRPY